MLREIQVTASVLDALTMEDVLGADIEPGSFHLGMVAYHLVTLGAPVYDVLAQAKDEMNEQMEAVRARYVDEKVKGNES